MPFVDSRIHISNVPFLVYCTSLHVWKFQPETDHPRTSSKLKQVNKHFFTVESKILLRLARVTYLEQGGSAYRDYAVLISSPNNPIPRPRSTSVSRGLRSKKSGRLSLVSDLRIDLISQRSAYQDVQTAFAVNSEASKAGHQSALFVSTKLSNNLT